MRTEFNGKAGESMKHTPYGYTIENGKAVIDESNAERVRVLFQEYIACGSMRAAAVKAGIEKTHSMIGRILKNRVYIGTEYYPPIVGDDIFAKAQKLRENNARSQNRIREYKVQPKAKIGTFSIGKIAKKYDDPYKQAEYVYSQITEVLNE